MNFFLFLWRIFVAIPLSFCVYIFAVRALMPDPINLTALLIWCGIGYILSLSTPIRAIHRRVMYRSGGYRALMYFLMILLNAVIMPVTLFLSVLGRIYRLINYNKYLRGYDEEDPVIRKRLRKQELKESAKAEREARRSKAKELARGVREDAKNTRRTLKSVEGVEREVIENGFYERRSAALGTKRSKRELKRAETTSAVSDRIRKSMWHSSADRAVKKLLDKNYKGDIRLDDGVCQKTYKQVAIINLNMQKYALLAEYGEGGLPSTEADVFAIVPSEIRGNNLILVEDAELSEKVFSVYRTLLAEKVIYNA